MKIALILQGGGAAGSWQAGVLEALIESHRFRRSVVSVVGTSIGGLNGALLVQQLNFANSVNCSIPSPITLKEVWKTKVNWHLLCRSRLKKLILESFNKKLLVLGPTYLVTTAAVVRGKLCPIKIRAEYDMMGPADHGLRIFQFGPSHSWPPCNIFPALLSTSAIPWLFGPVLYNSEWLSDGGLVANLPADVIKNLCVDAFVVISPNAPNKNLSLCPISRGIERNMRKRLCALIQFASSKLTGSVPVYHLHPGFIDFQPPGIFNFSPNRSRQSFSNGYDFGRSLKLWAPSCLKKYLAT